MTGDKSLPSLVFSSLICKMKGCPKMIAYFLPTVAERPGNLVFCTLVPISFNIPPTSPPDSQLIS